MDSLSGANFVGPRESREGGTVFRGEDPATGVPLDPEFAVATAAEVDAAARLAEGAAAAYAAGPADRRAAFLRATAGQLEALGDELLSRAEAETARPRPRLTGERARTANQAAGGFRQPVGKLL